MEFLNEELLAILREQVELASLQEEGGLFLKKSLGLSKLEIVSDEGKKLAILAGALVRRAGKIVNLNRTSYDSQMKGP